MSLDGKASDALFAPLRWSLLSLHPFPAISSASLYTKVSFLWPSRDYEQTLNMAHHRGLDQPG